MKTFMRSLWILILLPVLGYADPPQVDQAEVLRLGDLVQCVGDICSAGDEAFVAAMGPPASDADKWFISVITKRGCSQCEQLKKDWSSNEWLLALAQPTVPKQSWAHYTIYDRDDRSQAFRFENIKVTAYPTILVQPPRTGRYGDPATVVYQGVYGSDPEKQARAITGAIRQYVAKLKNLESTPPAGNTRQVAADPPWQPTPRVDPWQPSLLPNVPLPTIDPTIPPQSPLVVSTFPWSAVLTLVVAGFSMPAAIALVIWVVSFIRARRQAAGQPPLVDQKTLDQVLDILKRLADTQIPPASSNTERGRNRG